jgi:colicin import membrane protein
VGSEAAVRAVQQCAPYTFLPIAKYELWQDIILTFDPDEMFRG